MTGDELRERVAHSIRATQASRDEDRVYDLADVAIAIVLEEVWNDLIDKADAIAFNALSITDDAKAGALYEAARNIKTLRRSTERNEQ